MASFSLTEKLAVTGAFLAVVAMAVGTEDEPGVIATSESTVTALRSYAPTTRPPPAPAAAAEIVVADDIPEPVFVESTPEPQYQVIPLASRPTTRGALVGEDLPPVARPRSPGSSAPAPASDLR